MKWRYLMQTRKSRKMMVGSIGVRYLPTLLVSASAMAFLTSPALAIEQGEPSKALICVAGLLADKAVAEVMPLEPANGATVPPGTAVTFSGASNQALVFNVASSAALLSSPDIDSGAGSQSGAFSRFTSTKATATPRTIYWTASLTVTPMDCESPSTFTTPARTLLVAPTEAELAAAKARQEEEAAKKRLEEEAAVKKEREEVAAAGSVVLDWVTIEVENSREAAVELTCADISTCAGKLTLTANVTVGKGEARHARAESIGTANFSIGAGVGTRVKLKLGNAGRMLLSTAYGHLSAILTIYNTAPLPAKTQTRRVRLVEQKPEGKK
jgi:hypothetical protein